MRQRVIIDQYGIEGWRRRHLWLEILSDWVALVGILLSGMGLGWILSVLHGGGVTP